MSQLQHSITLPQGTGLLVTAMLGTGVFILPQLTSSSAGMSALMAWGLLILAMLPVTWIFAELGKHYPHAGGPSHVVRLAFGNTQGRVVGLMFLLVVPVGAPAAIEMTMQFVHALIPLNRGQTLVVELVFIGSLVALNWRGVQTSGRIQSVLTVAILLVVVAMLLSRGGTTEATPPAGNASLMMAAMGLAFWSFMGIETMSHLSAEFKNPKRDFGRALMLGVVIVGLIYLACTWLILTSGTGANSLAMVNIFDQHFGGGGKWVIGLLGIFSGAATVNVYIASVARLAYSLADQNALPGYLKKLNRHQVPGNGLITICAFIALILLVSTALNLPYEELIRWANGVFVLIYLASMMAAWRLLRNPWALVGATVCLFLAIALAEGMAYAVLLWFFLLVFYTVLTRRWLPRPS